MRRTKEWWNCLTEGERSRLVFLERARGSTSLGVKCAACGALHVGAGLCTSCMQELLNLINKADKKCSNLHKDDSMRDAMEEIEDGGDA